MTNMQETKTIWTLFQPFNPDIVPSEFFRASFSFCYCSPTFYVVAKRTDIGRDLKDLSLEHKQSFLVLCRILTQYFQLERASAEMLGGETKTNFMLEYALAKRAKKDILRYSK